MKGLVKEIPLNKSLDGARVLFRHFLSTRAPCEGWIREISVSGAYIRISKFNTSTDIGTWHRVYDLRIVEVLEDAKAPVPTKEDEPGFVHREDL